MALSNGSIVDYLNSQKQDSSYAARKKLAEQYGIQGYSGTAAQNTQLLKSLQGGTPQQTGSNSPVTVAAPVQAAPVVQPVETGYTYRKFSPSSRTDDYYDRMQEYEDSEPAAFKSQYDGAISAILDGILNKKPFKLEGNANYEMLMNNMREQYMQEGNKAMRDTMGNLQAQTGGYGSSAAAAAGGQAYDSFIQGMGDQNAALAQLAYQMYGDELADRYNQLGAIEGVDDRDYQRWLNDYQNWQNNRAYFANRYDSEYNKDFGEYQYDNNMQYQMSRDELSDYDNAVNMAYQFASKGLAIPTQYKNALDPETLAMLNGLAAEAVTGSSKGGSGSSGGGGRKTNTTEETWQSPAYKDAVTQAKSYAKTSPTKAKTYLEGLVDKGYLTEDEALIIYDLYVGGTPSSPTTTTGDNNLGYSTPKSYEEFVALTGQSGIMTKTEFTRAKQNKAGRASGYSNYQDYLNKMYQQYK